ncbi:HesB/IscA family protein [Candidatus Bandiella euplotis]|uniref:Iron-binding protein IscA n=1 Tax=Candidatus Bandiella euplotis TaxID=1664265 RepID=A0ABZ0UL16_9RICK|nr:iron-sulfur cluster assembly accessory protein [Candidatus Bandiella woodruffii]WPX96816.1 Iron-binding protein IscA [Candidatus Bandiella woodruffii]
MKVEKSIISITQSAASHIKHLIEKDKNGAIGIRVSIETGGCSGSKYKFEYVYEKAALDEEISDKGVRVFVSPATVLKIFGTTLDYVDEQVKSGFIFINPNEKGKCGCGESVYL